MDLQLFKKGSHTQVVTQAASVPEPTAEEREYQRMMNDYIRATAPTAIGIQQKAANMLFNDPGVTYVDYSKLGNEAAKNASKLQADLTGLREGANSGVQSYQQSFNDAARGTNAMLGHIGNAANKATAEYGKGLQGLAADSRANMEALTKAYGQNADDVNRTLGLSAGANLGVANKAVQDLAAAAAIANKDNSDLIGQLRNATNAANASYDASKVGYGNVAANAAGQMDGYGQGVQNQNFVDNKTKVMQNQLKATLGDAVNNLAQRGVINSSVADKALQGISSNVADSLNKSYNSDLAQQAALANNAFQIRSAGQQYNDALTGRQLSDVDNYVTRANQLGQQNYGQMANNALQQYQILNQGLGNATSLAQQMGTNRANALNAIQGLYGQNLANQGNYLNQLNQSQAQNAAMQSGLVGQMHGNTTGALTTGANMFNQNIANQANMIDQASGLNLAPMQALNAAQNASIDIPGKLFALATGQAQPTTDAWQNMLANRYRMANPENMHVMQSGGGGGGFLQGMGSALVGAFCVTGDTPIETPFGKMDIADIIEGDSVYNGDEEETTVTAVLDPIEQPIVAVETNEYRLRATPSQPLMTESGWVTIDGLRPGVRVLTEDGWQEITSITDAGREYVYDLKVAGRPSYIAGGFVIKAGEAEWQ